MVDVDKDAQIAELTAKLAEANATIEATQLAHATDVDTLQGHLDTKLDGLSLVDLAKMRLAADADVVQLAAVDDAKAADATRAAEAVAAVQLEDERRQAEFDATQESLARSRAVPGAGAWTPQGVHYGSGCI